MKEEELTKRVNSIAERLSSLHSKINLLVGEDISQIWEAIHNLESGKQGSETTQRIVTDNHDSITLGSPATGQIKVYGDTEKDTDFHIKVKHALDILDKAVEYQDKLVTKREKQRAD